MPRTVPKVRLCVEADLAAGAEVALDAEQARYLFTVLRLGQGAEVAVFNGRDGEWRGVVEEAGRRGGRLVCAERLRAQVAGPDLWLMFAPLKKARTDFVVEKAVELGAARLMPVFTARTASERVRTDRLRAQAREAAEQCERLDLPEVAEPVSLPAALDALGDRRLMVCAERVGAPLAADALAAAGPGPWAVLVGPEGGFAPEEIARIERREGVVPVSLGPRILRADTAVVAALTLWQATLGDWRGRA